jgi:16S rRNA (guanine966-N2)-methyltransferase
MRIIAGTLKGRELKNPHNHKTHPMSEKMRAALFNILGDIEGLTFLDAFAGTGALAFEAASRGAGYVVAVEKDRAVFEAAEQSTKMLRLNKKVHVTRAHAAGWSSRNIEKDKYDVLLLDPPYDDLQPLLLQKLIKRHIKPDGLAVLSYPGKEEAPEFFSVKIVENKNYGDSQLIFYRKMVQ